MNFNEVVCAIRNLQIESENKAINYLEFHGVGDPQITNHRWEEQFTFTAL